MDLPSSLSKPKPLQPVPQHQVTPFSAVDKFAATPWNSFAYGETMKKPIQISFRVTDEQARKLDGRRGEHSRGECARRLMIAALEGQDSQRLLKYLARIRTELDEQHAHCARDATRTQHRIDQVAQRVQSLREDLAMAIAGVLTNMQRSLTQEQATDFVRRTLLANANDSEA